VNEGSEADSDDKEERAARAVGSEVCCRRDEITLETDEEREDEGAEVCEEEAECGAEAAAFCCFAKDRRGKWVEEVLSICCCESAGRE